MVKYCQIADISRQAYYKQCLVNDKAQAHEALVLTQVRKIRMSMPRVGTRKLHYLLNTQGICIGRDRLFRLLNRHRLLVIAKRAYHKTTHSHHRFYCHPNIIKDGTKPHRPEELWVADITYFPTYQGESYISLVTDAYSRKIVGYHVDDNMKASSVKQAFKQALRQRQTDKPLVHHSDRGSQYCSHEYQELHRKNNVTCSMTDGYDCYQNALAERINGILKMEFLLQKPNDINEARKMVKESVELYNGLRPHSALKYKTPNDVHRVFD